MPAKSDRPRAGADEPKKAVRTSAAPPRPDGRGPSVPTNLRRAVGGPKEPRAPARSGEHAKREGEAPGRGKQKTMIGVGPQRGGPTPSPRSVGR